MKGYIISMLIGVVILAVMFGTCYALFIKGILVELMLVSSVGLLFVFAAPIIGKGFRERYLTTKKVEGLPLDSEINNPDKQA